MTIYIGLYMCLLCLFICKKKKLFLLCNNLTPKYKHYHNPSLIIHFPRTIPNTKDSQMKLWIQFKLALVCMNRTVKWTLIWVFKIVFNFDKQQHVLKCFMYMVIDRSGYELWLVSIHWCSLFSLHLPARSSQPSTKYIYRDSCLTRQ